MARRMKETALVELRMVIDSTSKEKRTPFSLEPTISSVMPTRRENWTGSIFPSLSNRCLNPPFPCLRIYDSIRQETFDIAAEVHDSFTVVYLGQGEPPFEMEAELVGHQATWEIEKAPSLENTSGSFFRGPSKQVCERPCDHVARSRNATPS